MSQSSSQVSFACRRVLSLTSAGSTPGLLELPSPAPAHTVGQRLAAPLSAWAESSQGPLTLKLYTVVREAMQNSVVFDLFEDGPSLHDDCLSRLRALSHHELTSIISQSKSIVTWRQDGIGPAKMSDPATASEIVGLLAAAQGLMSAAALEDVCRVTKQNISAHQLVETRFTVLLLALCAALAPNGQPCGYIELRAQCKAALQLMKHHRPELKQKRRARLMQCIARALSNKQSDRLPYPSGHAMASESHRAAAAIDTPSDGQFVMVEASGAATPPAAEDEISTSSGAAEKQAFTKRWLSNLWS